MVAPALDIDALAAALSDTPEPTALLPPVYDPLDLLIALHTIVAATMIADIPRAQRAADVASRIASAFPTDALIQAQAAWSKGSALLHVPAYTQALACYDAALVFYTAACTSYAPQEPPRDMRVVQIMRVFCLTELGRYAEAHSAVELAEDWLATHDHPYAQLTLLLNRGFLAGSTGDFVGMIALADATIALATELNNPARLAQGWINRAYACTLLGRLDQADSALDHGIAIATDADDLVTAARGVCNRVGILAARGQLFTALAVLREAQRGLAPAAGEVATIALEEALVCEQLRQLPEAQRASELAATDYRLQGMLAYSASAALHAAHIAIQRGQHGAARRLLDLAIADAQQVGLPTLASEVVVAEAVLLAHALARGDRVPRPQRKRVYAAAVQAVATLRRHGLLHEAELAQLAVAHVAAQLGQIDGAISAYESLIASARQSIRLAAHAGLGAVLPGPTALPHLQRAADMAVEQRRLLPMEEMQARYSSETSTYHLRLASQRRVDGDAVRALESIWAAKAGPLLDLRATIGTLDESTRAALDTQKHELGHLRALLLEYQRQAHTAALEGHSERLGLYQDQVQATADALSMHERRLTDMLRLLGDRGGAVAVPSVQAVQAALAPGMVVLEYVQDMTEIYCIRLLADGSVTIHPVGEVAAIAMLLDRWRIVYHRLLRDQHVDGAEQQLARVLAPLAARLLDPLLPHDGTVQNLLIAPMGLLHEVSWAALLPPNDAATVTLTLCGALWTPPPESVTALAPVRVLGYAGAAERHLPHVIAEVAQVARHLPNAQVVLDARSADLRASPPPRLLHIAAHALTVASAPLCSTIELADGPFLLLEAHRLNLHGTRLVTLSACETGARPECGEMTLALAGAFLCAGAQAVLASLWQVSDAATALLMDAFYTAVAEGTPFAVALRHAQLVVRTQYPLDWMAFQLWAGVALNASA